MGDRVSLASRKGDLLQAQICRYLKEHLHPSVWWTADAAGVRVTQRTAEKMKAHGVRRGWPDYRIMPDPFTVLWIEAKAGTGSLTTEQRAFRDFVAPTGNWKLARSVEDVRLFLLSRGVQIRSHPYERFADEADTQIPF